MLLTILARLVLTFKVILTGSLARVTEFDAPLACVKRVCLLQSVFKHRGSLLHVLDSLAHFFIRLHQILHLLFLLLQLLLHFS
jgi:hypothetical protein